MTDKITLWQCRHVRLVKARYIKHYDNTQTNLTDSGAAIHISLRPRLGRWSAGPLTMPFTAAPHLQRHDDVTWRVLVQFVPNMSTRHPRTWSPTSSSSSWHVHVVQYCVTSIPWHTHTHTHTHTHRAVTHNTHWHRHDSTLTHTHTHARRPHRLTQRARAHTDWQWHDTQTWEVGTVHSVVTS